ncbi:MAG: PLDc N-terminal domain-containing protein [Microbacterium enclense]
MDAVNPLIPTAYDLVWSGLVIVALGLAVWAIVSLSRAAPRLTSGSVLVWVVVILFVPVLGALAWLAAGRRAGGEVSRT